MIYQHDMWCNDGVGRGYSMHSDALDRKLASGSGHGYGGFGCGNWHFQDKQRPADNSAACACRIMQWLGSKDGSGTSRPG